MAHTEKMKERKNFQNFWHTDLTHTIQADTCYCCFAAWCGPCASYSLRKRALNNDMSRYTCCAGYKPCSGWCGETNCPRFCLATEVFLCFGPSVSSTRFLLQDELEIKTTLCDNCIIGCMLCFYLGACIFDCVGSLVGANQSCTQLVSCLADNMYCTVCACMLTQHKVEMDKRDGKLGPQPMAVPPHQQMSQFNHATPK